jgi:hypothetical protein
VIAAAGLAAGGDCALNMNGALWAFVVGHRAHRAVGNRVWEASHAGEGMSRAGLAEHIGQGDRPQDGGAGAASTLLSAVVVMPCDSSCRTPSLDSTLGGSTRQIRGGRYG